MSKFHITEDGPKPCSATKRPCPIGGEHFESREAAEKAYEEKFDSLASIKSVPAFLQETPEGAEKYAAYRAAWNENWDRIYRKQFDQTREEHEADDRKDALAARAVPGTYTGAWVPAQADGGVPISAGEYVYVSTDGWYDSFEDPESEEGKELRKDIEKWEAQAYVDTPPGTIGGAYLKGKASYLLTSMSMGENHGYDGEMLVAKETFDELATKGYFTNTDMYEASVVTVKQDTVLYGDLGNPGHTADGVYDFHKPEDEMSGEAMNIFMGQTRPLGSLQNHPFIELKS